MKYEKREHWRGEAVSFMALSSIKGVGFWTLHRIAKSGTGFKEVLKVEALDKFEKILGVKILNLEDSWESSRFRK